MKLAFKLGALLAVLVSLGASAAQADLLDYAF
jgi:hypothetical protein